MLVENGYLQSISMHVLFVNDKQFFDNATGNSSNVKRYVCRKWLHAEHIHACSLCER